MTTYQKILSLPLFQGMNRSDLETVVASTKFNFLTVNEGVTVIHEGDAYRELWLLLRGLLRVVTHGADGGYSIEEQVEAPALLQPERLFGMRQRFTSAFTAATRCHFITLSKSEVLRLQDEYIVFRLNFLNTISTSAQRLYGRSLRRAPSSLSQRLALFFSDRCRYPAGEKVIRVNMTVLARELHESRLDISRALHDMEKSALITLSRGRLVIPSMERLSGFMG